MTRYRIYYIRLHLTPIEAYRKIQWAIEQVNVIMGVRQLKEMMGEADLADQGGEWTLRIVDLAEIFSKRFGMYFRRIQLYLAV